MHNTHPNTTSIRWKTQHFCVNLYTANQANWRKECWLMYRWRLKSHSLDVFHLLTIPKWKRRDLVALLLTVFSSVLCLPLLIVCPQSHKHGSEQCTCECSKHFQSLHLNLISTFAQAGDTWGLSWPGWTQHRSPPTCNARSLWLGRHCLLQTCDWCRGASGGGGSLEFQTAHTHSPAFPPPHMSPTCTSHAARSAERPPAAAALLAPCSGASLGAGLPALQGHLLVEGARRGQGGQGLGWGQRLQWQGQWWSQLG